MDLRNELIEQRAELAASVRAITEMAAAETRDLNDAEDKNLNDLTSRIEKLDARIEQLTEIAVRQAKAAEVEARVSKPAEVKVTREAEIYRPDGEHSFFKDLMVARVNDEARERLVRAAAATTDATAVIPPRYLLDELIQLQRYGRPVANALPKVGDPSSWLTTYVPKVDSGLDVDWYTEGGTVDDNTAVINSNVQVDSKTIAGMTNVNVRLLETSGVAYDRIVWSELTATYALKVEDFVLNGTATAAKGLTQVSGTTPIAFVSASPTAALLYGKIGEAKSAVFTNRKMPATHIIMTPERADWVMSRSDGNSRPLFAPVGPENNPGNFQAVASEGYNFSFGGLPVLVSGSLSSAGTGAATPADEPIIVARLADAMFWEGTPSFRIFEDVLSANMQVRFRMHNNVAVTFARHPKSIAKISGSGIENMTF